jgi:hypothetical protein
MSFRTGYFVNMEDSDLVEYDSWLVAKNYLTGWFMFDCVSGIPFSLFELLFAANASDASALKSIKTLRIVRFLKLGRILKVEKILSNLDRDTLDRLEDFLQNINTRTAIVIIILALKMGYIAHVLSCLWVLVGREGSRSGDENWLAHEMKGPFDASDTTSNEHAGSIYLSAFYYTLTTMTTVGSVATSASASKAKTTLTHFVVIGTVILLPETTPNAHSQFSFSSSDHSCLR